MHYVLDGYNVIFGEDLSSPKSTGEQFESARFRFIEMLSQFKRRSRDKVTVVFDGGDKGKVRDDGEFAHGVEVIFSGPRASADDVIIERIDRSRRSRQLVVVSDDRQIRQAARRARIRSLGTSDFMSTMRRQEDAREEKEPHVKYHGISRDEVPWWRRYFDLEDDQGT